MINTSAYVRERTILTQNQLRSTVLVNVFLEVRVDIHIWPLTPIAHKALLNISILNQILDTQKSSTQREVQLKLDLFFIKMLGLFWDLVFTY